MSKPPDQQPLHRYQVYETQSTDRLWRVKYTEIDDRPSAALSSEVGRVAQIRFSGASG